MQETMANPGHLPIEMLFSSSVRRAHTALMMRSLSSDAFCCLPIENVLGPAVCKDLGFRVSPGRFLNVGNANPGEYKDSRILSNLECAEVGDDNHSLTHSLMRRLFLLLLG